MKTLNMKIHVDPDHRVEIDLPDDFPTGPASVEVRSESQPEQRPVRVLSGLLRDDSIRISEDEDPVAEAIAEVRDERNRHLERSIREISGS